jgi:hypothetical protein
MGFELVAKVNNYAQIAGYISKQLIMFSNYYSKKHLGLNIFSGCTLEGEVFMHGFAIKKPS